MMWCLCSKAEHIRSRKLSRSDRSNEPPESGGLEGQTALVTGATGGIGQAISEALVARGVSVGLVGRRAAELDRMVQRLGAPGNCAVLADLNSDRQLRTAARSFLRRAGRLDILVHCGGIHLAGPLATAPVADFDRLWTANVRGPFLLTQLLLPALKMSRGQIVFVNSSIGVTTRPEVGQFAATQHALRALAETLRAEVNRDGVRVLNVHPGRTATRRQEQIFVKEGRPYRPDTLLQPADVAAVVIAALALPRSAEMTEVHVRPMIKP
jgi:NADP-dependent 3-hydroxy acid dehydrogenase YdfG